LISSGAIEVSNMQSALNRLRLDGAK
jgi:hypothetical protein